MVVQVYIILEHGADRPYFSHTPPTDYQRKPDSKVYHAEINIPEFAQVDGQVKAMGRLFEGEKKEEKT